MTKEEFLAELTAAKPVLMRYALYFAGNKDDAEELLQEALYTRIWRTPSLNKEQILLIGW